MGYKDPEAQKAYNRAYQKEWYKRNKEKHKATAAANRKRYKKDWLEFKAEQKCEHCGASHPAIIDFHHIDKTDMTHVYLLSGQGRYGAAKKEATEKCIPLCANCHRILHWNEDKGIEE